MLCGCHEPAVCTEKFHMGASMIKTAWLEGPGGAGTPPREHPCPQTPTSTPYRPLRPEALPLHNIPHATHSNPEVQPSQVSQGRRPFGRNCCCRYFTGSSSSCGASASSHDPSCGLPLQQAVSGGPCWRIRKRPFSLKRLCMLKSRAGCKRFWVHIGAGV